MNPRDLIEPAARNPDVDALDAQSVLEPLPWVRDSESLASIAISLKRIADLAGAGK